MQSASMLPRPGIPLLKPSATVSAAVAVGSPDGTGSRPSDADALAGVMALLLVCALLGQAIVSPAALAQGQAAALQCRLGGGPWQPCRMEMQDMGLHWVLRIGTQQIEFRHSGDGAVRMQKAGGPWQPVTATWQPDASLCWDGVCAKGDIPLD